MTTARLSDRIAIRTEFARSANVERDSSRVNPGYVPTARAREVIRRVSSSLGTPAAGRALSITGTYGSGKSSLAVFLGALFGTDEALRRDSHAALEAVDPGLADEVSDRVGGLRGAGMLVGSVTAQREPVTVTVARALAAAIKARRISSPLRAQISALASSSSPDPSALVAAARAITADHGLLLIVDEFGKNIEEFLKSGEASADLFVLQELAEWAAEGSGEPLVLILLQHLAFSDYDQRSSSGREWAKVQGRFSDIPYIEAAAESQSLMASVFTCNRSADVWARQMKTSVDEAGLSDLLHGKLSELYPLHPVTAVVLPDLCYRYGQNERTLFAFLAGPDAAAVPELLHSLTVKSEQKLPSIRLHHVYDYFLASAPSMVTASPHAARWIEIETRIRDAAGLDASQIATLKALAVLNLVSSGGAARASRLVLQFALLCDEPGLDSVEGIDAVLDTLIQRGFVTYREFADEFRIWSGTDYDIQSMVEAARRSLADESPSYLLNRARPQIPVVAARHSQSTGVLRVFDRQFIDADSPQLSTELGQDYDGLVLLCLGDSKAVLARDDVIKISETRPVVVGVAKDGGAVRVAAVNLAAHQEALLHSERSGADWVAQRELRERVAAATAALDAAVDELNSGAAITWIRVIDGKAVSLASSASRPLPSALSSLCDLLYPDTPLVRNEMLSRRVLTSQGAKARRNLIEAMLDSPDADRCNIDGYPPERAMYEAVLGKSGLHRRRAGILDFGAPSSDDPLRYKATWNMLEQCFHDAATARLGVRDIYLRLMQPPVGLKEGPIPILLTAALVRHADDVAIYEDGTFVPRLDITVVERLMRNPDMFAVQSYVLRGPRRQLAEAIVERMKSSSRTPRHTRLPSVVTAVGPLLTRIRALPDYALKTKTLSQRTVALRTELLGAREPDRLLFKGIPEALGHDPVGPRETDRTDVAALVKDIFKCLNELEGAHPALLRRIRSSVIEVLGIETESLRDELRNRFGALRNGQSELEMRAIIGALVDEHLEDEEWLAYLGMVAASKPTQSWTDADAQAALDKLAIDLKRVRNLEALPREARPGHRAVMLGLTEQDGFQDHRVVWISESQIGRLNDIVERALEQANQDLGGNAEEALLAAMTVALLRPSDNVSGRVQNRTAKKGRR